MMLVATQAGAASCINNKGQFEAYKRCNWQGFQALRSGLNQNPPHDPVLAIAVLKLMDRGVISCKSRGDPYGELGHMQFLAG